jgi:hypothetical protein
MVSERLLYAGRRMDRKESFTTNDQADDLYELGDEPS